MNDNKKTILAIDDDITILNAIRTILESNYEISLAKNIDIAKKILNTAQVDLILLDMNMPNASGIDFLNFLKNENRHYHIPVIIVSSQGTADVIIEAKKNGAVDFVVKPISPNILAEKIRQNIKKSGIKITRESLERLLKKLLAACTEGKSGKIEKIVDGLERFYYERITDMEIASICKYARDLEYNHVEERVRQLLSDLPQEC